MSLTIYPAIDVRGGRVVRLEQGDFGKQSDYGQAPVALAQHYESEGARWLHLVDLDAALGGGYSLLPLVGQLKSSTTLRLQTGGGVRSERDVERLLRAGVDRVVVGTVAVHEPAKVLDWMQRYGAERMVIALDTRRDNEGRWRLPVRGWTEDSPLVLDHVLDAYCGKGLVHLLCTDIARDGMLTGFNLPLYQRLGARWPQISLQASGGATDLGDLRLLREAGVAGAVLGRALLEGKFSLEEALAC